MTKEELTAVLAGLPNGTQVYVRHGHAFDDAYPAKVRLFEEGDGITLYVEVEARDHRNFPEGYGGVVELEVKPIDLQDLTDTILDGISENATPHQRYLARQAVSKITPPVKDIEESK